MQSVEGEGDGTSNRRVVAASVVGTVIEWYDFTLYGSAAALVFSELFFPSSDPVVGTLAAFATYAVGFLARPVGGLVFGHYGDRIGRKPMLVITLLLMGVATTLIGLLPTFATIGVAAPILLVLLRLVQGAGAGAEYAGAVLMVSEHAPPQKRGLYASWPAAGVFLGILLAAAVFTAVSSLPEEQFLAWGWRVPFVLSIVVVAVGIYIRLRIEETPAFQEVKESGTESVLPIRRVLTESPRTVVLAMGLNLALTGPSYIIQVFTLSYVTGELGVSDRAALAGLLVAYALALPLIPLFASLSDRIGRRPLYLLGAGWLTVFPFPYFLLLRTGEPVVIGIAIFLAIGLGIAPMFGTQAALYTELFDTRVRYSAIAFSREFTGALVSGPAPFIATALLVYSGGDPWLVAVFMSVISLGTLVAALKVRETFRAPV